MLFNSIHYLIYLPIVTLLYFHLPLKGQRLLLIAAGFYFYSVFSVPLCLLMVWATAVDYLCARWIEDAPTARRRKLWLIVSLTCNLGVLATFKYVDFFNNSILYATGHRPWPLLHLILPFGISFYTFEAMSYTIDVYRRDLKACRTISDYALFITFFPHLVAGPIMRAGQLIPQFNEIHRPNLERMGSGVVLCVWGLLKKVLVADPMGRLAEQVYGSVAAPASPEHFSGFAVLMATYAFAAQIYCDFSAYSDIAIGTGRILGFRVVQNFDAPYLAATMRDFWRRWHISLSSWLRDYLYIPLGGSRGSSARTYVNLMITMLLGGLWHGANWTFVIWGGLHGAILAAERALGIDELDRSRMSAAERILRGLVTFHLVCLTWVFFRATSAKHALALLGRVATWGAGESLSAAPAAVLLVLVIVQTLKRRRDFGSLVHDYPRAFRWAAYACMLVVVRVLAGSPSVDFIYFQF